MEYVGKRVNICSKTNEVTNAIIIFIFEITRTPKRNNYSEHIC